MAPPKDSENLRALLAQAMKDLMEERDRASLAKDAHLQSLEARIVEQDKMIRKLLGVEADSEEVTQVRLQADPDLRKAKWASVTEMYKASAPILVPVLLVALPMLSAIFARVSAVLGYHDLKDGP